jgi:group II intron reverse transcriptase/maturase
VIQQATLQILTPIFEEGFSESSYGFRPKRSAHNAIVKAKEYVTAGNIYVVDIDLEKFFDKIQHEVLMKRVGRKVKDRRVLTLIRSYLKSGIMEEGVCIISTEGTPQGGPLSPLLANIMLDDLDKELEKRGRKFCRYADDCNIYVQSEKSGLRVKESITSFIERALKLKEKKSAVDRTENRQFLGYTIVHNAAYTRITIAPKSIMKFKDKVREITRCRSNLSIEHRLNQIRNYFRGWLQFFALCEFGWMFGRLDSWVRRRLRMCLWVDWKKPGRRLKELMKLGIPKPKAKGNAYSSLGKWAMSHNYTMNLALKDTVLLQMGYYSLSINYHRIRKY